MLSQSKSWLTTTVGVIVIILTWANQILVEQGVPHTGKDWLTFIVGNITGLIGILAKDWNKTGGTAPAIEKPK
jgi:hypothetical protein